jgi:ABC-2 type transport system permease protein
MLTKIKNLIKYRELVRNLVVRDLKIRYKESFLGFLWSLLNPLLSLAVYSIVFGVLFNRATGDVPFSIFLFVALLPWAFSVGSINDSTVSILGAGSLVKKIYFPREIIPISKVLANLINFLFTLPVLLAVLVTLQIMGKLAPFNFWLLFFLPLIVFIQLLFLSGLSLILSSLQVNYRDVEHTVQVVLLAWFFLTPIVYDPLDFPHIFRGPVLLVYKVINPLTPLTMAYRDVLIDSRVPDFSFLGLAALLSLFFLFLGSYIFDRYEPTFAEDI